MIMEPYIAPERVLVIPHAASRDALFQLMAESAEPVTGISSPILAQALIERESHGPTSTPDGVAFPHAVLTEDIETAMVITRLETGVDFGMPDHPVCDLILCMFASSASPWNHVKLLARLARLVHTSESRTALRGAPDAGTLYDAVIARDRDHG